MILTDQTYTTLDITNQGGPGGPGGSVCRVIRLDGADGRVLADSPDVEFSPEVR